MKKIKINILIAVLILSSCDSMRKEYYESGEIKAMGAEMNGEKDGEWIYFNKSGDTLSIEKFDQGTLKFRESFDSGNLVQTEEYSSDTGKIVTKFFPSGSISTIKQFKNGKSNGLALTYYETGQLKSKSNFSNDLPKGEFIQYYPNGNVFVETENVQDGIFTFYDSLGGKILDVRYENYHPIDTLKTY